MNKQKILKEFFKELEEKQDREFLCAEQIDFLIILNKIKREVKNG